MSPSAPLSDGSAATTPLLRYKVPSSLPRKDSGKPVKATSTFRYLDLLRLKQGSPVQCLLQAHGPAPPSQSSYAQSVTPLSLRVFLDEEHPFGRSLLLSFSVLLPAAPLQRYSTPCSPDTAPSTLWTQTRSSDRKIIALLLAFIISQPLPEPRPPRRSPRSGRACRPAVWSSCRH